MVDDDSQEDDTLDPPENTRAVVVPPDLHCFRFSTQNEEGDDDDDNDEGNDNSVEILSKFSCFMGLEGIIIFVDVLVVSFSLQMKEGMQSKNSVFFVELLAKQIFCCAGGICGHMWSNLLCS